MPLQVQITAKKFCTIRDENGTVSNYSYDRSYSLLSKSSGLYYKHITLVHDISKVMSE